MSIVVEMGAGGVDWGQVIAVAAAVVQAVGSVVAILAAIWITDRDRHRTRRENRDARISALASIVFKAEDLIRNPYTMITGDPPARYNELFVGDIWKTRLREIDQCLRILAAIPVHEFEWELASAVMEMESALSAGREELVAIAQTYKARLMYAETGERMKALRLRDPVNLAAKAAARIHNLAHKNSMDPEVRKMSIAPALVD